MLFLKSKLDRLDWIIRNYILEIDEPSYKRVQKEKGKRGTIRHNRERSCLNAAKRSVGTI